jgi:hydrogenase maturation protein HypF
MQRSYNISITGTVQGVGFRPFIYTLASRYQLKGSVSNTTRGVSISINATTETLDKFIESIKKELPPLASLESITTKQCEPQIFKTFKIIPTATDGARTVGIPPDMSICKECEAELFDPTNHRYLYPFITCTHCGVRYSIIYELPYDRQNTSMKFFQMCSACQAEYSNPLDRRYHAQPIGCHSCGPKLTLWQGEKALELADSEIVQRAATLLKEGNILAIKGVGGYHLMCDATDDSVVQRLRQRKRRPGKPFAVMAKDMNMVKKLVHISTQEEQLLSSQERPIVLLQALKKPKLSLSSEVAPDISKLGLFLPYTPLHLLLLDKVDRPLVATSANITDEPLCTNRESLSKLSGVYDYILDHDREIVNGCDDSVVTLIKDQVLILRRARGYAPASVKLPFKLSQNTLALGANQKSTIAIGFEDQAILSPHIGDLEGIASVEYYKQNIATLKRIYDFTPNIIAHDLHPNYESTKVAKELSQKEQIATQGIQHHYAHILGVMAEKGLQGKVLGVAFDGTGYGEDGTLWGGEFLVCDYLGYERVAQLEVFKLLGGEKAIKEPRRIALSLLFDLYGEEALKMSNPTIKAFSTGEAKALYIAWQKGLNAPLSSSMGRLFDAVASLVGVSQVMSYEGQSGMLLEELYDSSIEGSYPFNINKGIIDIKGMLESILAEREAYIAVSKFFHTIVEIIRTMHIQYDHLPLVLAGGVFQNRVLVELLFEAIPNCIISNTIPPNDGAIALGQVVGRV